jgi:hypothetical protein
MNEGYVCQRCGCSLQGNSSLCITCFKKMWHKCGACDGKGQTVKKVGGKTQAKKCTACKGEGWFASL